MFKKAFDEITIEDIKDLVSNRKEREIHHLEYKETIGNSDRDKKEFLKDVSGFANANGGYLIIGVREQDGIPSEICGINKSIGNQKIDEWIDNVLISNLDERIRYGIRVFDLLNENRVVVLLYVPESPKKPHMVTFQNKNTYYIRHNTSVNPATQSEVREMFEYSKKNKDKFEEFLKTKNLFNERDDKFGYNENIERLFNDIAEEITEEIQGLKKPFILYSFISRYLDENRVNTIAKDFIDWMNEHSRGFEPAPHVKLFDIYQKKINLYGVVFPKILPRERGEELWQDYFEVLNNGFFESGISNVFLLYDTSDEHPKPVLNLTWTVGYAWILLNFAQKFYRKINYYDEVVFQISIVNVKNFTLGGFGKKNRTINWAEPFDIHYPNPPHCTHEKFKIIEKFIVSELSSSLIKDIVLDLSNKISRAFGKSVVKCFDDEGNFNNETMNWFRRAQ